MSVDEDNKFRSVGLSNVTWVRGNRGKSPADD